MMLTGEAEGDLLDTDDRDSRCTLLGSMEQALGPSFDANKQVLHQKHRGLINTLRKTLCIALFFLLGTSNLMCGD